MNTQTAIETAETAVNAAIANPAPAVVLAAVAAVKDSVDAVADDRRARQEAVLNGASAKTVKPAPKPRAPRGLARDQRKVAAIAAAGSKPAKAPVSGNPAQARAEKALDKARAAKPKVKPAELNPTRAAEAKRLADKKAAAKGPKAPAGGKRAAMLESAQRGVLPDAPDFSAETHKRWRGKLDDTIKLVKAGDVKALKALEIPTYSSSPQAIARYRDLAVVALEAKAAKAKG